MAASPDLEAELEATRQQPCPRCQVLIPVHSGYTTWCDNCGWTLDVPESPPYESPLDKIYRSLSRKSSKGLFEQMLAAGPIRGGFNLSTLLAYLLAAMVHAITASFVLLGGTHPSIAYRTEFLKTHFVADAKVILSEAEAAQLKTELTLLEQEVQSYLFSLDDISFRQLFQLNW
jgi:hypothetical protein